MSEQLRVGIVGSGAMGGTHAFAWGQTPAKLCGIVSKSNDTATELGEKYSAKVYGSLDEMLPDIDVLDICAPTHLHREMTLAAAKAGVHVICEKPLARTAADGKEMIDACQTAGVKLLVAHVVRYFPEYSYAHEKVMGGEIGEPAIIRLRRGAFKPNKAHDNWFDDHEKSGGLILDMMIHDFDFARWLAGDVKTVFAKSIGFEQPEAQVDHALAILTHENGVISHVEGSWAYPPPLFRTHFEIAGSNGLIDHNSDFTTPLQMIFHQSENSVSDVPLASNPMHEDPYTTEIKAFYEHLVNDTPLRVTAADGLEALKIGLAAVRSAQTGLPVQISDMEGSK